MQLSIPKLIFFKKKLRLTGLCKFLYFLPANVHVILYLKKIRLIKSTLKK
uniref:Uncharacterized protein n=1 Tax=Solanum lycopersicum TaxID=4081 RepID=A0A3Q7HRR3_SOLLC